MVRAKKHSRVKIYKKNTSRTRSKTKISRVKKKAIPVGLRRSNPSAPKRKNSRRRGSRMGPTVRRMKNISNPKKTWENFLKNKDSINALQKSWVSKNPQQYYRSAVKKLAHKYGSA